MKSNCQKKILSSTINGQIVKCLSCNQFHIEYKNLQFNLDTFEFSFFKKCFLELDASYWEVRNQNTISQKKILIDLNHENISARFNQDEIIELQVLLSGSKMNDNFIKVNNIDATFGTN